MSNLRTACLIVISVAGGLSVLAYGRFVSRDADGVQSQPTRTPTKTDAMPTEVTYPQVYATPNGETHFREVRVPLRVEVAAAPAQPVAQSQPQPATTIRHFAVPPNWGVSDRDQRIFHPVSSARFITVRRGVVWIRTSDGETRRFQPGDVIEVLDVAPSKGHISWVGDEGAVALFSNHP
jgi:hypothetical protein